MCLLGGEGSLELTLGLGVARPFPPLEPGMLGEGGA